MHGLGGRTTTGEENRCHAEFVPCVASLDAFDKAMAEFVVEDLGLVIEPTALAAAGRSLDSSGLLLLGEMHGVRENPCLSGRSCRLSGSPAWPWNGPASWHP